MSLIQFLANELSNQAFNETLWCEHEQGVPFLPGNVKAISLPNMYWLLVLICPISFKRGGASRAELLVKISTLGLVVIIAHCNSWECWDVDMAQA